LTNHQVHTNIKYLKEYLKFGNLLEKPEASAKESFAGTRQRTKLFQALELISHI